ncbi:MAG: peptidylprolyl isomerase, partial [Aristaeellaceae bacterium]
EGYRAVKHVLIKFNDEQSQLYDDLQSQLDSLNEEKEALEAPAEETGDAAEAESTDAEVESTDTEVESDETEAPRTLEEINADIAACATELEALYAQLMPTAEEVIAAFNDGTSFDELIEKYNEDPGMTTEPTATIGYAVSAGSDTWDPAFTEGAMSIAEVGQISEPVYGSYGIHIIYYMSDITPGAVALEEIHDSVEELALSDKIQSTYENQVAAWVEEANVEYFYSNFGIAE